MLLCEWGEGSAPQLEATLDEAAGTLRIQGGRAIDLPCISPSEALSFHLTWQVTDLLTSSRETTLNANGTRTVVERTLYAAVANGQMGVVVSSETAGATVTFERRSTDSEPAPTPTPTPAAGCVPPSLAPADGEPAMDNGRSDIAEPLEWSFEWGPCADATQYELYVIGQGALNPAIDAFIDATAYTYESLSYITGQNLTGWTWKVRARVSGSWGPWSPTRTFDVEPPNSDPPLATPTPSPSVCVPELILPDDDDVGQDNGRTDNTDPIVWTFEWAPCASATEYQLFVINMSAEIPVINVHVDSTEYTYDEFGYISLLDGWTWKVRANVNGEWGEWSPTRTFSVEPPNSDPPP